MNDVDTEDVDWDIKHDRTSTTDSSDLDTAVTPSSNPEDGESHTMHTTTTTVPPFFMYPTCVYETHHRLHTFMHTESDMNKV